MWSPTAALPNPGFQPGGIPLQRDHVPAFHARFGNLLQRPSRFGMNPGMDRKGVCLFNRLEPGGPGSLPSRGSHRSVRADFPHTAPRFTDSLGKPCGERFVGVVADSAGCRQSETTTVAPTTQCGSAISRRTFRSTKRPQGAKHNGLEKAVALRAHFGWMGWVMWV